MIAVCSNVNCGNVWNGGVSVEGMYENIQFSGCTSTCPECGSVGVIPNATYSWNKIEFADLNESIKWHDAIKRLRVIASESNHNIETIQKRVQQQDDKWLSKAWDYVSKKVKGIPDLAVNETMKQVLIAGASHVFLAAGCSQIAGPHKLPQQHIPTTTQQAPQTSSTQTGVMNGSVPQHHLQAEKTQTPPRKPK